MINKKFAKDMLFSLYNLNGWKSYFIKIRFWDAPFTLVEQLVPKSGTIIELGCGEGCFTNYMGLSSSKRNILGIELSDRVLDADKGLPNVRYKKGNALSAQFPKCNAIVAFHLLHHLLSFSDQELLLQKIYKSLPKKGVFILVEIDKKPLFQYVVTWITDHFFVPWLFERRFYSNIYFRSEKEWKTTLKNIGFSSIKSIPMYQNKPFSHITFICVK